MPHIAIDPTHPTTAAHAIAMAMADATVESTSPHMAHQWAAMGSRSRRHLLGLRGRCPRGHGLRHGRYLLRRRG